MATLVVSGREGATVVVSISGELDLASVPSAEAALEALAAEEPEGIVFELTQLSFLDSSGLAVLLGVAQRLPVTLRGANPVVQRIVATTGLGSVLPIESTLPAQPVEAGRAALSRTERRFAGVPESAREARQMTKEALENLPADAVSVATAMVSELATNALVHARTGFDMSIELRPGPTVRVEVSDSGSGWPAVASPSTTELHGRGLHMVESLSDRWGVDSTDTRAGKTVWFELVVRESSGVSERGHGLRQDLSGAAPAG